MLDIKCEDESSCTYPYFSYPDSYHHSCSVNISSYVLYPLLTALFTEDEEKLCSCLLHAHVNMCH